MSFDKDVDDSIINKLENYKATKSNYFSTINWKIILIASLIVLGIIIFGLILFRNFLKKNINDDLFLNILDIVYILLIVNICIGIFTITNLYYRINKIGPIGPPGKRGAPGKKGPDKKCNIFKKRINRFKKETIPKNLIQRIENAYIPPPQTSSEDTNKWYICNSNMIQENDFSKTSQVPAIFSKSLTTSKCIENGSCLKVSKYSPPNNKPINGCIINVNTLNNIINAIQFTYDSSIIPSKIHNEISLVGMNNTCSSLKSLFTSDNDKNNNIDRYIIKSDTNYLFKKEELDNLYKFHSKQGDILNYTCNSDGFFKQFNIAYVSFKPHNNKYLLYGTAIYNKDKIVFKENHIPKYSCKSCKYDNDQERFVNDCSSYDTVNKCINNNCVWKDNRFNQCNLLNETDCKDNAYLCQYDESNKKCIGISKCDGESIGNNTLSFTKTKSFKTPPRSAIYKIETFSTIDDGINPGELKGIRFYARDIITSDDVLIEDENGNKNFYIGFGYEPTINKETAQFLNVYMNSFTAPVSVSSLNKESKLKYYPSFIGGTSVLYNNTNLIGLEINSCVYYKND